MSHRLGTPPPPLPLTAVTVIVSACSYVVQVLRLPATGRLRESQARDPPSTPSHDPKSQEHLG